MAGALYNRRFCAPIMSPIADHIEAVRQRIVQAALACRRDPATIELMAVSKTFPSDAVRDAFAAGQVVFGENYVQEAVAKVLRLADIRDRLSWHFIGPLQSNKVRLVAEHFDWMHSVDRLRIAQRLSELRPAALPDLQVCIQVNIDDESTKSGVAPDEVQALAEAIQGLPRLKLRGLMAIPAPQDDPVLQRAGFKALAQLKDQLVARGLALDTLSMGMSDDLEAAIAEGATIVRVGTAIFGARSYPGLEP
jgi:pyridoxal phosphate enzyme (YggS family)